jgi:hypothetical protein
MSITTGDLDSFGKALEEIEFWGASSTNPNDMRNNCVSVSLARMEHYRDVGHLWESLYCEPLPDTPLKLSQVKDLVRLTNYEFT